jgi:alpha-tubulin suppressor-like RCC1 family protein
MADTCKAVWNLQQVRDQILAGAWVQYDNRNDPGQLWSWGSNNYGRLGDGTIINRSSPVQLPGTQWNDISGGSFHSLARKTDGTLWSWGYNGLVDLVMVLQSIEVHQYNYQVLNGMT